MCKGCLRITVNDVPSQYREPGGGGNKTEITSLTPSERARKFNSPVFFAHPFSSWQRGSNENTKDLIWQYFLKKTDFPSLATDDLSFMIARLNN